MIKDKYYIGEKATCKVSNPSFLFSEIKEIEAVLEFVLDKFSKKGENISVGFSTFESKKQRN